jgi:hypothetical protein
VADALTHPSFQAGLLLVFFYLGIGRFVALETDTIDKKDIRSVVLDSFDDTDGFFLPARNALAWYRCTDLGDKTEGNIVVCAL